MTTKFHLMIELDIYTCNIGSFNHAYLGEPHLQL